MSNFSAPAGTAQQQPGITITINIFSAPGGTPVIETKTSGAAAGGAGVAAATGGAAAPGAGVAAPAPGAFFEAMPQLESRPATTMNENDMDYSDCEGFDPQFMGIHTPLPKPGTQLSRMLAEPAQSSKKYVLDYYHYSTMHHTIRRMPVVSAINIDGNPNERQDDEKRKDKWLRDNRIDFDIQLNDAYYKKSGFDKGHMSRREDANWADNADDAYRDANLTCMYTNAVPQVPDINRAVYGYHGLWGQLEQIILEKGVEQEDGDSTKICVYNGPIFVSTDKVYQGVQVPLRFFKIVVWKNGAGQPKTTAFILSQENLVGGIQFEELHYDEEFKPHQCSVAFIEHLTDLTFTTIRDWDTFVGPTDGGGTESVDGGGPRLPVQPIDRGQLEALVRNNNVK